MELWLWHLVLAVLIKIAASKNSLRKHACLMNAELRWFFLCENCHAIPELEVSSQKAGITDVYKQARYKR